MSSSDLANIKPVVLEICELKMQIAELEKRKAALEAEARPVLADRGLLTFDRFQVEVKVSPGRKSLDKEAVAAALGLPDLSSFEKDGKPFTTMTIKETEVI